MINVEASRPITLGEIISLFETAGVAVEINDGEITGYIYERRK